MGSVGVLLLSFTWSGRPCNLAAALLWYTQICEGMSCTQIFFFVSSPCGSAPPILIQVVRLKYFHEGLFLLFTTTLAGAQKIVRIILFQSPHSTTIARYTILLLRVSIDVSGGATFGQSPLAYDNFHIYFISDSLRATICMHVDLERIQNDSVNVRKSPKSSAPLTEYTE